MKKIILALIVLLILAAVPTTVILVRRNQDIRQRAAPATTLEFSPQTLTVSSGETFDLNVVINTGTNQVTGADIRIVFDPEQLEATDITKGAFLPNILAAGEVGPGTASIALGAPSTTPGSGTGTLATVSFTAISGSSAPVSVRFSQPGTQVVAIDEQTNVLINATPAVITVSGTGTTNTYTSTDPTPTPAGVLATTITSPPTASTTLEKPTIVGKTFPLAPLTITITATTPITQVITADSTGNWSFTPTSALESGSHTITATTQNPDTLEIETVTRTFTVSAGGQETSTTEGIPVAGSILPTAATIVIGSMFLLIGSIALL